MRGRVAIRMIAQHDHDFYLFSHLVHTLSHLVNIGVTLLVTFHIGRQLVQTERTTVCFHGRMRAH